MNERIVGEKHHSAKLTAEKVQEMRSLASTLGMRGAWQKVAPEVSWTSAHRAINGLTWKHL
jgi:hypothetical protein